MSYKDIQVQIAGHIATILLNRPEKRNALSLNTLEEMRVSLLRKRGYHFIDLRIFSAPQRGEEKESTSWGITLPLALFSEFRNSILEVEKKLMEKGLLDVI